MDSFCLEIADTRFSVSCRFGSTREYFRRYLSGGEAAYALAVSEDDLAREQIFLDREADEEGLRRRIFSGPFLERAAIQRKIAGLLLNRDILLLHGSTIAVDGYAYLFTAACGVGKSTHTKLWRDLLGERAAVINDDRAFLRISKGTVIAYGSPWSGKHGLDNPISAPLAAIAILERGKVNRAMPLPISDALPALLRQAYLPEISNDTRRRALTEQLSAAVPLYRIACTPTIDAAQVAFAAIRHSGND